jgi:hypothetical protein
MGVGSPYFPIGLGYLAAVLEQVGYETKIYNGEVPRGEEKSRYQHRGAILAKLYRLISFIWIILKTMVFLFGRNLENLWWSLIRM